MSEKPALEVSHVSKRFGGTQALDDVTFTVGSGEIHGLLGENGSGKSTLIRILAGFHAADAGGFVIHGTHVATPVRGDTMRKLGLAFVHQDLALVPGLSVVENLKSGHIASSRTWRISWKAARQEANYIFEKYGLDLDPSARVAELAPSDRALLAIVRAIEDLSQTSSGKSEAGKLLVLDEPTVFLPRMGVERLFELVREHARRGASIVFVSHDLDEVQELTDTITVLRDGRVVGTSSTKSVSRSALIEMIIGRRVDRSVVSKEHAAPPSGAVLSVRRLRGEAVKNMSISVNGGEVVGLAGLPGSGFDDVPYLLFGAIDGSGEVVIDRRTLRIDELDPERACRERIALVPGDRKRDGAAMSLAVEDNVTSLMLRHYHYGPVLRRRVMTRDATRIIEDFDVRPRNGRFLFATLSGGNQQKAILGKWLRMNPRVLLLHEPTQGVDVGAREQIWAEIRSRARASGQAVMCASTDHEELASLCDRVLIFARGEVAGALEGPELSKESIGRACYGA